MKIIEAMKKVKQNKQKILDLQAKINGACANLSHETPLYGAETPEQIKKWAQSCEDLSQDNITLLCRIQKTNLATQVTIELGEVGARVTKSIAEWVWRRREYAAIDLKTWMGMNDRGLKEGFMNVSTGGNVEVKIVRHYNPTVRDTKCNIYRSEPHQIDAALEVVNAVTDLLE